MQEVIEKINNLYEELVLVQSGLDKSIKICKEKDLELNSKLAKYQKDHDALLERERILTKYEDFEKEKECFFQSKKDYTDTANRIDKDLKHLEIENKRLDKLDKALQKKGETTDRQVIALKERAAAFEEKKKELKGLVSGSTLKEMLA